MHIKEVVSETPLEVIKEIDNEENITLEDAEKISPKESLLGYYLNGLLKKLNIEFIQIFTSNAIKKFQIAEKTPYLVITSIIILFLSLFVRKYKRKKEENKATRIKPKFNLKTHKDSFYYLHEIFVILFILFFFILLYNMNPNITGYTVYGINLNEYNINNLENNVDNQNSSVICDGASCNLTINETENSDNYISFDTKDEKKEEYVEMLVRTSDKSLCKSIMLKQSLTKCPENTLREERRGNSKQGYIIRVEKEGFEWGNMEKDFPTDFAIVRIPASEFNASWLEPEYDYDKPMYEFDYECLNECILNYGEIQYCYDSCYNIIGGYEVKTERKYKLPLESFLTAEEIADIRSTPCDYGTIKPALRKNVTDIADKIVLNVWEDKSFDWVGPGQSNCEYYNSLGEWSVIGDSIVGYPQYNGKRQKVLVMDESAIIISDTITLEIPAGTTVTSENLSWDGNITIPTVKDNSSVLIDGKPRTIVEVGFSNVKLSLNKGARIIIPGEAGSAVGYGRSGEPVVEITSVCDSDTQEFADTIPDDTECKIDVGNDLIIWTKHFSEFITYTPENLKLWLPFKGNANDESGNGNNAVVYGATLSEDRKGNSNSAYYFDGNDYMNLGTSNFDIDETNEFTVTMWIKPEQKNSFYTYLIQKGDYAYPFKIEFDKNKNLRTIVRTSNPDYLYSNSKINYNEWHHVAMTYKEGSRVIYIDGVEDNSNSLAGELHFGFGTYNNKLSVLGTCLHDLSCSQSRFKGNIDDVRIYNKALSAEEISNLY